MRIGAAPSAAGAGAPVRDVEARRTPASMGDIRVALARAIESSTGKKPDSRTVDVLAAQVSLETAHGGAMFNYNFGGIKGASPRGESANYLTREVVDGRDVHLQQGFRAYESLDEGARDYIAVLRNRFPQAYTQATAGNVDGFAHALKQSHYFTAPEAEYAAGLRAAAGSVGAGAAPKSPGIEPVPSLHQGAAGAGAPGLATSEELSRVLDAIALSAVQIAEPEAKD
ncbi:MAG: glucosaminidase domain-containing protein [Myxococcales bacterium]|nr:glucosaminidase domain-containing protein [Myxococcales bacterium]